MNPSQQDEPAFLRRLAECRTRNADRLEESVLANQRARLHRRDMRGTEELVRDLRAEADILARFARMLEESPAGRSLED